MEVHKRTPHEIFNMPQRLLVPLFQRPYVWSEEAQWEPLWDDIIRVAERYLAQPQIAHQPHFIGAVVLQQMPNSTGGFQERTIIDGQQRLTTLQILLDAMHAEFEHAGATKPAKRLERLIRNDEEFCTHPEDEFKVWPTNRDRPAFCEVMAAATPVDYNALAYKKDRLPQAHKFFSEQVRDWLKNGEAAALSIRADALETTARELLQVVVIDLAADENAQEIFETLNARGAQLSAADLIKNFIFQRLLIEGADTESAYEQDWKQFETAFWEKEVKSVRNIPRAAVFLNHFLVARTGEVIGAQEVFTRFKTFATHDCGLEMRELLRQVHAAAKVYEAYILGAEKLEGSVTPLELFSYRMTVLKTDSVQPLILNLIDPEFPKISDEQLFMALNAIESFVIRRMIMSANTKNYNVFFPLLIAELHKQGREKAGTVITDILRSQTAEFRYWPDDEQISNELQTLPIFRKGRRLRMILEALEDHRRGFKNQSDGEVGEGLVIRGKLTLEHILPQTWETNWPLLDEETEQSRRGAVHLIGNMTLLTKKLNSKVSNGAWLGKEGKATALAQQSTLLLNRDLTEDLKAQWTTNAIAHRTNKLTESFLAVWPVPTGHKVVLSFREARKRKTVSISDLLSASLIEPGAVMRSTWSSLENRYATVLADGNIETDDGVVFNSLSGSGRHVAAANSVGGWRFWSIGEGESARLLSEIRNEYRDRFEIDADTTEESEESEE